jgi:hypothetical protein
MRPHPVVRTSFLVVAALLALPAWARAVTVSVVPADTTVTIGGSFSLRLVTDAFPDLKGFETIHSFDASKLQLTGANPGDVLTSSGNPYSAFLVPDSAPPPDSAWYDAAMLVGSSAGPGILVFLNFNAVSVGDCPIVCQLVDFRDSNNNRTLPNCVGGMVHIVGPVPARKETWGRIKSLYR